MTQQNGNVTGEVAHQVILSVGGMSCAGCASRVEGRLLAQPGVQTAEVSLQEGRVVVRFDPSQTDAVHLAAALSAVGYDAAPAS